MRHCCAPPTMSQLRSHQHPVRFDLAATPSSHSPPRLDSAPPAHPPGNRSSTPRPTPTSPTTAISLNARVFSMQPAPHSPSAPQLAPTHCKNKRQQRKMTSAAGGRASRAQARPADHRGAVCSGPPQAARQGAGPLPDAPPTISRSTHSLFDSLIDRGEEGVTTTAQSLSLSSLPSLLSFLFSFSFFFFFFRLFCFFQPPLQLEGPILLSNLSFHSQPSNVLCCWAYASRTGQERQLPHDLAPGRHLGRRQLPPPGHAGGDSYCWGRARTSSPAAVYADSTMSLDRQNSDSRM